MAVPLLARDEVLGVLLLIERRAARHFEPDEVDFARRLGTVVGLALENARLFKAEAEARRQADRELATTRLLLEAAGSMAESVSIAEVLHRLAQAVLRVSGHSRATISSWHEDRRVMEVVLSAGEAPLATGFTIALDAMSDAARTAVAGGKSGLVDYDALQPGRRGVGDRVTSHLVLHVPMFTQGRLVGFLAVDDPGQKRAFSERDIELIEGIASQAAVAIENARLYEAKEDELSRAAILREVAAAAAGTIDQRELSAQMLDACRRRLGAKAGNVYVIDRKAGVLDASALFGFPEALMPQLERMELDESPGERAQLPQERGGRARLA